MVDARFDPTIKYDSSDGDDGVDHDDDHHRYHHRGCRNDNVQGSNSSKWTTRNAWNRNSNIFQGWFLVTELFWYILVSTDQGCKIIFKMLVIVSMDLGCGMILMHLVSSYLVFQRGHYRWKADFPTERTFAGCFLNLCYYAILIVQTGSPIRNFELFRWVPNCSLTWRVQDHLSKCFSNTPPMLLTTSLTGEVFTREWKAVLKPLFV